MRHWIKDPLAILADGAERGVVVEGSRIVEMRAQREPSRWRPSMPCSTPRATSCSRASSTRTTTSSRR